MSLSTDASTALAEMITEAGETIIIYGTGWTYTGTALVTGGAENQDAVTGGFYEQNTYSISVRKTSLGSYVPAPQMSIDARGKKLRIPDDGVTDNRMHYHIVAVGRDVPRQ